MKRIDLEQLVRRKAVNIKHADYILLGQNVIIVVEETSRPKLDDIAKLEETVNAVKTGLLEPELPRPKPGTRIVAVIHRRRRSDILIAKALRTKSRRGQAYTIAGCERDLANLVSKLH